MTIGQLREHLNNSPAPDGFIIKVEIADELFDIDKIISTVYMQLPIGDDAFEVISLKNENSIKL